MAARYIRKKYWMASFGPDEIRGAPAPGMFQFPGYPRQVPEAVADSQPLQVQGHRPTVGKKKVGGGGIAVNEHLPVGKILAARLPGIALAPQALPVLPGQQSGLQQLGRHLIQVSQGGLGRDRQNRDRPGVKKGQQVGQFFQAPEEGRRLAMDTGLEQETIQVRAGHGFQEQSQGPLGPAAQEPGNQAAAISQAQAGELHIVVVFPGQAQIRGDLGGIGGEKFSHDRIVSLREGEAQDLTGRGSGST